MLTDYHVHLRVDEVEATAERAFTADNAAAYRDAADAAGIEELGVSEHVHRFADALSVWRHPFWERYAHDDLHAYVEFVRSETDLRLGIEADFIPGREDRLANLLEAHDFDYVVGSVHFLGDRALDADDFTIWDGARSAQDIWSAYFRTLGEAALSGLFDILAHPDLVKVWGGGRPVPDGDLRRFYEPAIEAIAQSDIAVEVSTAGLRKPVGELYPSDAFLAMALEAGAPVALSSDAHRPQDVGYAYDRAVQTLRDAGVTDLCVFERRSRSLRPLGEA